MALNYHCYCAGSITKAGGQRPPPLVERDKDAFLARITEAFANDPIHDPEEAACSVFRLLNNRISAGEIRDVRQRLPKHLRELWPEKAT